jgi:hypothetical protein
MKQLYLEGKKRAEVGPLSWIQLEYYLTKEEYQYSNGPTVYGMTILKKSKNMIEIEETGGVSHSKDVVLSMLQSLIACTITPMVLLEVVDDMVTTRICS